VAIDLSMEHARRCRATGADVVRASVRRLPFLDGSFDAMWTMSTLMHVPDAAIDGVLDEIARVLRTNATAAIGVWGGPDVEDYGPDEVPPGELRRLFSRRSDERWRSMLETIGVVEAFETWSYGDDFGYQFAVVRSAS
jgi:SAM-dependent methyltransferase